MMCNNLKYKMAKTASYMLISIKHNKLSIIYKNNIYYIYIFPIKSIKNPHDVNYFKLKSTVK